MTNSSVRPNSTSFGRVGVLNRGEAAVRFMRALREYALEREVDLSAVAFYTDPDEGAPFLRLADDVVHIGPAMRTGPLGQVSAYCDYDFIIGHLKAAGCDAVWPGWGFIAEDAVFVARLEAEGIAFIGPSSHAMWLLGDKIEAKRLASTCGVPLAPWFVIEDETDDATILNEAARIGFPLMLKASAGGGGRGIRKVTEAESLLGKVADARLEVKKVFEHGGLMMEACITGARHIEVQLVAGADGVATAMGVRDCTLQRRNQKIIEEAPSPVLPDEDRELLTTSSARLAEASGYRGVATAEFLYNPESRQACFLEVNSRLQVEHTVTEMVTGCDLVKAQLDIARGLPWEGMGNTPRGHAIEVRLNAENPEKGFAPSPGRVQFFRPPSGPGIRVDSGVAEGMNIAPEFDSMIAKVIAWGPTRRQATVRLQRALQELDIVVEDGATNQAFLAELLTHEAFVDCKADTGWLDRAMLEGHFTDHKWEFEAIVAAAILEYRRLRHTDIQKFFAQAQNGIPQNLPEPAGIDIELRLRGNNRVVMVFGLGGDRYLAGGEGNLHPVRFVTSGAHTAEMVLEQGARHKILYSYGSTGIAVEVDGVTHAVERSSGGVVKASAPAMVVSVGVSEGDAVKAGDRLCTLEAMKMEMAVLAPRDGLVRSVLCRANQQVSAGQPLVVIEEADAGGEEDTTEAVSWAPQAQPTPFEALARGPLNPVEVEALGETAAGAVIADLVEALRGVMTGYDVSPTRAARLEELFGADIDFDQLDAPERWAPLASILNAFVDTESLFDRNLLPVPGAAAATAAELLFYDYCRRYRDGADGAQESLRPLLKAALAHFDLRSLDPSDELREAIWRLAVAHAHGGLRHRLASSLLRTLMRLHSAGVPVASANGGSLRLVLERVAQVASSRHPFVADNARQAIYVLYRRSRYVERKQVVKSIVEQALSDLASATNAPGRKTVMRELVDYPHGILPLLVQRAEHSADVAPYVVEAMIGRLYRGVTCEPLEIVAQSRVFARQYGLIHKFEETPSRIMAVLASTNDVLMALDLIRRAASDPGAKSPTAVELILKGSFSSKGGDAFEVLLDTAIIEAEVGGTCIERMTVTWCDAESGRLHHRNYRSIYSQMVEEPGRRDVHPEAARRIELWRLSEFELERMDSPEKTYAFRARAKENSRDERIFIISEIERGSGLNVEVAEGAEMLWSFEQAYFEAMRVLRDAQSRRAARRRFHWNRLYFYIHQPINLSAADVATLAQRFEAQTRGLGVERIILRAQVPDVEATKAEGRTVLKDTEFVLHKPGRHRLEVTERVPSPVSLRAMTSYEMRVVRARQLGYAYPYDLARMLQGRASVGAEPHPAMARGRFVEYDLDESGEVLVPVDRPYGCNKAGVVVGLVENVIDKYPEGMERVFIASDPTVAMGALAEPECRRVLAAVDLARERQVPIEWLPVSAGAKIAMDSGTENLDWTARVLKKLVEFSQEGGEINIIVAGVNVGAQSYWNAEATMLMHTKGVLIMTRDGSMVLTGKKALEYSGSVAAEDERGIGGFERIMGPNGQAQYHARDLGEAYTILFEHYRFSYVKPGEDGPRRFETADPIARSVVDATYARTDAEPFGRVGEIFDAAVNPGRKKPFAIREVMGAVIDQDGGHLERFSHLRHGESAVIWDAHIGGFACSVIGIESRPMIRRGRVPMDGPEMWTGGTLFPNSSRKVARAINSASNNRPVVVLANLSGFDGSPESLRRLQLEYGAEIGRSVVNFQGPIVFVVIGRYHGGAYVVFSKALNPELRALALTGAYASVIGGAPAAAVVFPREVRRRANADPRILDARRALESATPADRPLLRERLDALYSEVVLDHQGEVAREFDAIHTVERAVEVGSLDAVISPDTLRPAIVAEIERAASRKREHLELAANG